MLYHCSKTFSLFGFHLPQWMNLSQSATNPNNKNVITIKSKIFYVLLQQKRPLDDKSQRYWLIKTSITRQIKQTLNHGSFYLKRCYKNKLVYCHFHAACATNHEYAYLVIK